jgi:hypothetical protein
MTVAWESFNENYRHPLHSKEIDSFHAQKCEFAGAVKVKNLDTEVHAERGSSFRRREIYLFVQITRSENLVMPI